MSFWGVQGISCTVQGTNPLFAGDVLEKLCPFTNRKPWPFILLLLFFFFPSLELIAARDNVGFVRWSRRWGTVCLFPPPSAMLTAELFSVIQKLFAGLRLFQFICRLLNEGCGGRGEGAGTHRHL